MEEYPEKDGDDRSIDSEGGPDSFPLELAIVVDEEHLNDDAGQKIAHEAADASNHHQE